MLFLFVFLLSLVLAKDFSLLQPHCVIKQIEGTWTFQLTDAEKTRKQAVSDCKHDSTITPTETIEIKLELPNIATDTQTQKTGTWTMVDDVGMEIRLDGRRYLSFYQYKKNFWGKVTSYCNKTWTTWYRLENDTLPAGDNYGCMHGEKKADNLFPGYIKTHEYLSTPKKDTPYPVGRKMEKFRVEDQREHMNFMKQFHKPVKGVEDLPESWDWTKINDTSYVSYVKDQEQCGSCYIFGTVGMLESRKRILTDLKEKPFYSEQDMINCGLPYGDQCGGGFPFLVSKFFQENGMVSEKDVPYAGYSEKCKDESKKKIEIEEYQYVGGYYGASNEENMMMEIYNNGPIVIAFYVEDEFFDYTSQIYRCFSTHNGEANHAVTLVGWGKEGKTKYWKLKNSWGSGWGDLGGYFLLERGEHDCNVMSSPSYATFPGNK